MTEQTKGEKARAEILEAAKTLFLTQGYSGTSMRDIAKAAGGRAVAGIYNHFPTKEDIFRALIEATTPYHEIVPVLEATTGDTAPEFIGNAFRPIVRIMVKHVDFFELLLVDTREFSGEHILGIIQSEMFPRVFNVLLRLANLPGLQIRDPLVLLRMFISMVAGYVMTYWLGPRFVIDQYSEDVWIEHYLNMLLHGLTLSDQSREEQT